MDEKPSSPLKAPIMLPTYFLGVLGDPADEAMKATHTRKPTVHPAGKFQWGFIGGLEDNLREPVQIINVPPVGSYPRHYGKVLMRSRRWSHAAGVADCEIGCVNLPVLKQMTRSWLLGNRLRDIAYKEKDGAVIYVYSLYQPFLSAIRRLPSTFKIIAIVPDLPEHYDIGRTSVSRKLFRIINNKIIRRLRDRIDGYVLLTEHMAQELGVSEKPHVVVEGILDPESYPQAPAPAPESSESAILYSGSLNLAYGIKELVEAFMLLEDESLRLWICGSGEGVEYVRAASSRDRRIEYRGLLGWEDLRVTQQRARLLVNPRRNEGEYTRFSFPSKTMEYLASGRPVAAYRLDGIPHDYEPYVLWLEPGDSADTADQLRGIMQRSDEELLAIGARARSFVLAGKNQTVQVRKVIDVVARLGA